MSRPGFVLEVEARTPALLLGNGGAGTLQAFPEGAHVAYPNEVDVTIQAATTVLDQALSQPSDGAPLVDKLTPDMRLTIAVTGLSAAPMDNDVRASLVTRVLDVAARVGVNDVVVVLVNGAGRRLSTGELRAVLGTRVVNALRPDGLIHQHTSADEDDCVEVGTTSAGEPVTVNRRIAESDLVVTVNVARQQADAGLGLLAHGATGPATINALRGYRADDGAPGRVAEVLADSLDVWAIDAVTDQQEHAPGYDYLAEREWEWSMRQSAARAVAARVHKVAPAVLHARMWESGHARALFSIASGEAAAVADKTRSAVAQQQVVAVPAPADVVVATVTPRTRHNAGAPTDPLTAAWSALHRFGRPGNPLRPGGAVLVAHPLRASFDATMHQAAGDFFSQVLPQTTDPQEMHTRFEERFASDDWYRHLHRNENAYAAMHPLHLWYDIARALDNIGEVVWIGADRTCADRMGMRAATTLADAREIVSHTLPADAQLLYLHPGATMVTEVTA